MMDAEGYVHRTFGGKAVGDEVITDCIFCGKEGHMYINTSSFLAHCFVCGAGANLVGLIQAMDGCNKATAFAKATALLHGRGRARMSETLAQLLARLHATGEAKTAAVELPDKCVPITHKAAQAAVRYLAARGFTERHFAPYRPLYVPSRGTKFHRHIVVPSYNEHGELDFFATRRAVLNDASGFPKSYTPSGASKKGVLFGLHGYNRTDGLVFIVEGPLDMLALSGHAIAMVGSHVSDDMAAALARRFESIVLVPDGDVPLSTTMHNAERCVRLGLHVRRVQLKPAADPGDMVHSCSDPDRLCKALLHASKPVSSSTSSSALRDRLQGIRR